MSMGTICEVTFEFLVGVGLYHGSNYVLYLFTLIMDYLTTNIQDGFLWCMLFTNEVVLISHTRKPLNDCSKKENQ